MLLVLCRRVYDALVPFKPPKPQIPIIVEHVGNESDDNLDSGEWMWGGSIDSGLGIAPPPPPPPQPVAPMQPPVAPMQPPTGSSSTGPLELICKKHKKEQKRVPTNFIFDQMLTYRDPEDNRLRMAISIFQKRTKETRFNITIRCLRLREEKEDGSAVLEWDGGNILVPYCSVEKEIIPHSMDETGYYVVDVETYQEVTADDEGSVYGDEEEEGTVVEA